VASILISGGRSLCPVKNRGGSFDKVVDQNFTPIFQSAPLTILASPYFSLPLIFHWVIYTINKTLPIFTFPISQSAPLTKLSASRGKKPKAEGKT